MPMAHPTVVYVQDLMDEWLGEGAARVILPITDPYVVHHGALGSLCHRLSARGRGSGRDHGQARRARRGIILMFSTKAEAIRRFELPGDRIGDIVMVSGENICIGTSEHRHDLAALKEPLRSHGGLDRTGGALHREPGDLTCPARRTLAQLRCVLLRHHRAAAQ